MFREIDDTTSDIALEVFASDFFGLIKESGKALCSEISDLSRIKQSASVDFIVKSHSVKDLIHNFLSIILTKSDIEGLFFVSFKVISLIVKDNSGKRIINYYKKESGKETSSVNSLEQTMRKFIGRQDLFITMKIKATGEDISREKSGIYVKGITYYDFSVDFSKNKWYTKFVCDV